MQTLVKIRQSAAELLHIFDFQNGGILHLGFDVTSYRTTHDLCLMVLTSSWNCTW